MDSKRVLEIVGEQLYEMDEIIRRNLAAEREALEGWRFISAARIAAMRGGLMVGRAVLDDLRMEIENSAPAEPAGVLPSYAGDTEPLAMASAPAAK